MHDTSLEGCSLSGKPPSALQIPNLELYIISSILVIFSASILHVDSVSWLSPGKKRALVAVGIGKGVKIFTLGPVFEVSACQLLAKEICADLVEP